MTSLAPCLVAVALCGWLLRGVSCRFRPNVSVGVTDTEAVSAFPDGKFDNGRFANATALHHCVDEVTANGRDTARKPISCFSVSHIRRVRQVDTSVKKLLHLFYHGATMAPVGDKMNVQLETRESWGRLHRL